jgi:heptosyltransferase-2
VRTGRYRYSKRRWRIAVAALDLVGSAAMAVWRRLRPARPFQTPRRILLIQLDHLGDAVLTSPLIERLHSAYPSAAIDVLASASNHEVFASDPSVRRVRLAEKSWFERRRGRWSIVAAVWALGRALRGSGYDLAIDVRGDVLSVLVMALAGVPRRVGWTMGGGGFLLTDAAEWVPGRHEVRSRLALLAPLGIAPDGPSRVVVHVADDDRVEVARRLEETWRRAFAPAVVGRGSVAVAGKPTGSCDGEPLLALHLGAGTAAKRWPPGHWAELARRFLAEGWRVVVVGGPEDADAASALSPHPNLCDWTGQLTVPQTAALLERADLFVGADSGPSHLAACAGVPSVVLFSGTNRVAQWRPWSRRTRVLREPVSCRPCHRKTCPLADHPCMSRIDVDRVHRAAVGWWVRCHRSGLETVDADS